MRSSKTYLVLG